ncbi:MAG: hypothetical protein ACLGXA_03795 [Acidobacteriota bacterium]
MRTAIVTTTIHIPHLLKEYAANARLFGHQDVGFIVIGDQKSPPETADFCRTIEEMCPCTYLDVEAQNRYLAPYPDLSAHLRFNSIQRRNVGLLLAYQSGAEAIITIDDDNYVLGQDFVGLHRIVGSSPELPSFSSTSGFFNVCCFLEADDGVRFYHRGYPQGQRWKESESYVTQGQAQRRIAVNAGFWLENPDIDALTRMERQPVVRGFHSRWQGRFTLQTGTWSPFNSQNTALIRDVIPAYFLSPYVGRYDDIWAGYIVCRIAEHLGDAICFGEPLVRQTRNEHDLWKDLDEERNGMILTDGYCAALRNIRLHGSTYHECFGEIAGSLETVWTPGPKWSQSQQEWRSQLIQGLRIWHQTFAEATSGAGQRQGARS